MIHSNIVMRRWWQRSKAPLIVGGGLFTAFFVLARLDGGWGAIAYIFFGILSLLTIPGWILANALYEDNKSWYVYTLAFIVPVAVFLSITA